MRKPADRALDLMVDALAVFRIVRLLSLDTFPPIKKTRDAVQQRFPPEGYTLDPDDGWEFVADPDTDGMAIAGRNKVTVRGVIFPTPAGDRFSVTGPHPFGELTSCPWCLSPYIAAVAVAARFLIPKWWEPAARIAAFSAVAGLITTHW